MAKLTFLGATGTVTGSKYLFEHEDSRIMIDCGLFQGLKELRLRNWQPLDIPFAQLDAVILTHAHIDHTGYLPRLVKMGYNKPIFCTHSTRDLVELMLLDSAHLQEEDAKYLNRKGLSKHQPALPLYGKEDAQKAISLLKGMDYETPFKPSSDVSVKFHDAGHILGSSFVDMRWMQADEERRIVFSGDLGRFDRPILKDPSIIENTDYLLVESTYGDRLHDEKDPRNEIKRIVHQTVQRGGALVIPAFAVGRTQELLYVLRDMEAKGDIPKLPVYVDSPMAIKATKLYADHVEIYDKEALDLRKQGVNVLQTAYTHFAQSVDESKAINSAALPCIIISASGMLTGGRILHHLVERLPRRSSTVMFVGYQAEGTRGRALQSGKDRVKIHGNWVKRAAAIETISDFSAHADYSEILRWLKNYKAAPKMTFIVHGEPSSSLALQKRIKNELNWDSKIPKYKESIILD